MFYSGVIKAAQRLTGPRQLGVMVIATDGGNRQSTADITITVSSIAASALPVFQVAPRILRLNESQPVQAEVARFGATSSSAQSTVVYSIAGGNVGQTFAIRPDGALILNQKLDYSLASNFDLWIQAKDSVSDYVAHSNMRVSVADENDHTPMFDQDLYIVSAVEQQSIFGSRLLLKVTASDPDSGAFGQVTYSLVSGNVDNPFILGGDGSLKLTKQLDRETIPRYELTIMATDGGGRNATAVVIVNVDDINDHFPRFESSYRWTVPEDVAVGSLVSTVKATDEDVGDNANIVYALETASAMFGVSASGEVKVKSSLDREQQPSYTLTVSAKNVGVANITLSGTTTVTITVSRGYLS